MSDQGSGTGWRPLSRPDLTGKPDATPAAPEARSSSTGITRPVTPFVRLARTHAFHAAGEASVFVTLAGTLLSIDPNDARSRILLALVLTMAPFALIGPFIGPALDRVRGGRRATIALSLLLRAALMVLLTRNIDTAWFFPIAFSWLVLGKTYSVAKAATVPTTVADEDELVDKNSRLAILSAVAGGIGVVPAVALYRLFGSTPTLWWAAIVYLVGVVFSMKMPRVVVDDPDTATDDDLDIRSAGVRLASFVMATLRGIVGFVFFLLLFEFVRSELPDLSGLGTATGAAVKSALGFDLLEDPGLPWYKTAIPFALWGFGGFAGNVVAPWLRRRFSEEKMLVGAVGAVTASSVAAVWAGGLSGAALVALVVGMAASAAKLAFDSLVQRDAPGANHGAAFGRFESQFQIAWVLGSLLAVVVSFPLRAGFLVIALAAGGIGLFIMQKGRSSLTFGAMPRFGSGREPKGQPPRQSDESVSEAPPAPPPMPEPPPTTEMAAVVVTRSSDPYGEGFAEQHVEPPDWAAGVFGEQAEQKLTPPSWMQDDDESRPPTEPNPTPPFGVDRVD